MKRAMTLAAVLFVAGLIVRPSDLGARSEEGTARPESKPQPTTPAFNPAPLFRETEETLRPPAPEKFREWAGALLHLGQPAAAKRELDRPTLKPDAKALAKDLVRRGQYETAANLLEPLLHRTEDPELALLQIACRLGLGQVDLARRPLLVLMESTRGPNSKTYERLASFVQTLVGMGTGGRGLSLEDNPWGVKFLPDKSGTPAKPLAESEARKLPADAEQILAQWLGVAPMQPTAWAVLGQILYLRGDPSDALESFKRAKAMGYNSPIIAEYLRLLEREESARRSAVMKQMAESPAQSPPTSNDAPVAISGSSSRAIVAFGLGGLLVGFLGGVWASRRK